jgi:hypothetical protein
LKKNVNDVNTLEATLKQVKSNTNQQPIEAICDRGYRGKTIVEGVKILIPKPLPATTSKKEIEKNES